MDSAIKQLGTKVGLSKDSEDHFFHFIVFSLGRDEELQKKLKLHDRTLFMLDYIWPE